MKLSDASPARLQKAVIHTILGGQIEPLLALSYLIWPDDGYEAKEFLDWAEGRDLEAEVEDALQRTKHDRLCYRKGWRTDEEVKDAILTGAPQQELRRTMSVSTRRIRQLKDELGIPHYRRVVT